jgi:hypothetical protein
MPSKKDKLAKKHTFSAVLWLSYCWWGVIGAFLAHGLASPELGKRKRWLSSTPYGIAVSIKFYFQKLLCP